MEYQILRWVTEELEPKKADEFFNLLTKVEARARLETIEQVLEALYTAKSEGLDINGVIGVIGDWYSELESEYRGLFIYNDDYKELIKRLNMAIKVTKLKREGKIVSPNEVKEAATG